MSQGGSRNTSPTRGGIRDPEEPQVGASPTSTPVAPWVPGEPITYSPPGMGFQGEVPIGFLHGSGAGLPGNPFTMQAPEGAGSRVPQPENAQGGSGGAREVLKLISQYLFKEMDKEGNAGTGDGTGQDKRRVMLDEKYFRRLDRHTEVGSLIW